MRRSSASTSLETKVAFGPTSVSVVDTTTFGVARQMSAYSCCTAGRSGSSVSQYCMSEYSSRPYRLSAADLWSSLKC
jgi:hypothetical protein